ncbi:MAG: Lrp/AsnC family transcriptional regulator [Candidatus Hadarchaeia archaeon]
MKKLDEKIIVQLLKNADHPIVDIAEKVGASRQTVSKKIEKFKESGLIERIVADVNYEKFGLDVRAYVFLQEEPHDKVREENEMKINKYGRVSRFVRLFGRYSGILEVWGENEEDLTDFVKEIHELEGIKETETFIVHSTVKDDPNDPILDVLQ